MSRASKQVYHPHGDANDFKTVEESLDSLDDRVSTIEDTTVPGINAAIEEVTTDLAALDASFDEATAADYRSDASGFKCLTPETVWSSTDYVALTDGTTISVDMSTGFNFSVSIAGNRTLSNPSNAKTGQSGCFKVTASGAYRTLTLDSNFKATSDIIEPVAIASGQIAYVFYWVDTSSRIIVTGVAINPT